MVHLFLRNAIPDTEIIFFLCRALVHFYALCCIFYIYTFIILSHMLKNAKFHGLLRSVKFHHESRTVHVLCQMTLIKNIKSITKSRTVLLETPKSDHWLFLMTHHAWIHQTFDSIFYKQKLLIFSGYSVMIYLAMKVFSIKPKCNYIMYPAST